MYGCRLPSQAVNWHTQASASRKAKRMRKRPGWARALRICTWRQPACLELFILTIQDIEYSVVKPSPDCVQIESHWVSVPLCHCTRKVEPDDLQRGSSSRFHPAGFKG